MLSNSISTYSRGCTCTPLKGGVQYRYRLPLYLGTGQVQVRYRYRLHKVLSLIQRVKRVFSRLDIASLFSLFSRVQVRYFSLAGRVYLYLKV